MSRNTLGTFLSCSVLLTGLLQAQQQAPPIILAPMPAAQQPPPKPAAPPPAAPANKPPAAPANKPPAAIPAPTTLPVQAEPTAGGGFRLNLTNASLIEVIDILAQRLKINYILDPRVKGSVTINTYGEIKPVEVRSLLETILRINAAAMVQVGDLFRIVPIAEVSRLPLSPKINGKDLPEDDRMILNLIFLKYATVSEIAKLIEPFVGEGARLSTYEAANLLLLLDNGRNMRRTLELIALFDSDTFAGQRVRLFEVQHGRPSDIAKELDTVFKSFALSEKTSSVKFMPIDRINTIIAVAPNPGIFSEVEKWLDKLDVPIKATAGSIDNYVYRLKYGRAETVAMAIMQLYGGYGGGYGGMGGFGMGGYGGGMGGYGMGGYGMGGYGGGMGGYGMGGAYPGAMGGAYGGGGMPSPVGMGQMSTTPMPYNPPAAQPGPPPPAAATAGGGGGGATGGFSDLTGSYLGAGAGYGGYGPYARIPRVIPNPFDNTLLVQATPQEWDQISRLLEQLDVPPRQVLIDAKIYEVDLQGAFSSGVTAALGKRAEAAPGSSRHGSSLIRTLQGAGGGSGISLSADMLVGQSRALLVALASNEFRSRAKVISAPSVIATDSIAASINVGTEVPTLTSQAVTGVQQGGNSLFANTVSTRNTGVTLSLTARVNSSGVVTMIINQEVSAPVPPAASSAIQSPSFSKRNVQTQVTVEDGDTIAIGGIIQESNSSSTVGIPVLHRIPILGGAFGNKSANKSRTELIIFLTPRVIYDTNMIADATEEVKNKVKGLRKLIKE